MATYEAIVPYADVTYATAYFAERLDSEAWAADAAKQLPSLQQATLTIDQLPLVGSKCDDTQLREFPRSVDDCDAVDLPVEVMNACCEVALALIQGKTPSKLDAKAGRTGETVGDTAVTYESGRAGAALTDEYFGLPSRTAAQLLAPWIVDQEQIDLTRV